jgi:aryl-alcohol dehydrogenase-like predicted oxidoreductase
MADGFVLSASVRTALRAALCRAGAGKLGSGREMRYSTGVRVALGCMRLSTESTRDDQRALDTLDAALCAGVRIFDTARSYALDEHDLGHNERLVAQALKRQPGVATRVITKCGMRRDGGAWIPDGRARTILEDARASVQALDGVPIDVLILHAPDPRVSMATSARALARVKEDGLARSVGVCNVSRKQLEEAAGEAPITSVEVALGAFDDMAIRSGVVEFCIRQGIEILAHSPLGGPERARRLARDPVLVRIALSLQTSPIDVFLAYLLAVSSAIVPIVGARRAKTAGQLARATELVLSADQLAALDERFSSLGRMRCPTPALPITPRDVEVVLLIGVPGSGKSRAAQAYVERGYERLNRDLEGGTLKKIARLLDERLAAGATRVVLDNTYVTRASRYEIARVAARHAARLRCILFETPLTDAQINVILRMLARFGRVLEPDEIAKQARTDPASLAPSATFRMQRDLEPPSADEGFAKIERVPFLRQNAEGGVAGTIVALAALGSGAAVSDALMALLYDAPEASPVLIYAWQPDAAAAWVQALHALGENASATTGRNVEVAVCPHPGGRPICWCRPPLPALLLVFAHRHRIDLRISTLVGASATDAAMARALGMRFRRVSMETG